jgi:DNA-directed RNA polymerase specialized sigma24 family protein
MELNALAEAPATRVRAVDPDAELVARARANPQEFLGLYDRYFDRVLGYARLRVADAATCEDVTSRVFTTALEQLGHFRGEGSFAERAQELHAVIGLLRPEHQHLLALRYGADLGYEEIGAIVGTAPATVRVRMHRILEELRRRYPRDYA